MARYEPIWDGVLKILGDDSVSSVGKTCRMLYFIARDELKLRALHYLRSSNAWKHGMYPERGYYGRQGHDDDDNEVDSEGGVRWVRCVCEHHQRLFLGEDCSCESVAQANSLRGH